MAKKAPGFTQPLGPIGSGQVQKAPGFGQVGGLPTPLEQSTPSKQYAEQYIAGSSLKDYIAANQGKWDEVANATVQTASEAVFGTLEAGSYLLDFEQHLDWLKGQEQEYTNAFAEAMKAVKQDVAQGMPIYKSQENEGFEPTNFEWWANHTPNVLGSAVSLLVPAAGVAKLGQVAKLGKFGQAVSATIASRLAESTMEASQVFERTLGELKNQGIPDKQAREMAGKQATNVWNTNWLFAATDFYQMKSLMKGFQTAVKGAKGSVIGEVAKQAASESLEEAGQFISAEEGFRAATQGTDYFGKGFEQRLYDYVQDDEFKTSALLGALGGAVFTGLSPVVKATQSGVQKGVDFFKDTLTTLTKNGVAKEKANSIGDTGTSTVLSNQEFNTQLFRKMDEGKVNNFKKDLEDSIKDANTPEESKKLVKDYIDDIDFITEQEAKVKNSQIPQQNYKQVLATQLEIRQLSRLQTGLKQDIGKLEQEAVKSGGLDQNILELKRMQLTANAYARLAKDNPKFATKATQLAAQFNEQVNSEQMKLAFADPMKALSNTYDDSLNQKYFQAASTQEKLVDVKNDLFELNTPEGRKRKAQEAEVKKQEAQVKQQVESPTTTKEQLQEAKAKVNNPELISQIDEKLNQIQQTQKTANQSAVQEQVTAEEPATAEILPPEDELAEPPVEDFEAPNFDNLDEIIDIPEEFEQELAEAPEEASFASLLKKQIDAEQVNEVPTQQPSQEQKKTKKVKSEAIKQHTVTAWGKEVKTEVVEGERKIIKDQANLAIPQTYYDNQGNEVQVTDVFATTAQGLLVSNTPEIKVGDPVLVRLVDNGKELKAPYSLTKGYRPTGEHNFVLWVYRILPDGSVENKPLKEIPSIDSPSDTNDKKVLAAFRKKVIEQGELRTTIADSTSYGEPRTGSEKTIDVFETDYVQNSDGSWSYGYTSYKPIIAFTGVGNKITVPNIQQSWDKQVLDRVDEAVNTVDHPGNRAPGSIYVLRTNQKGNLRFIQASKRKLDEAEKAWVKSNLSLLTQGRISEVQDVLYVENASIGLLSTKHKQKKPDILSKSRSRMYVLNGPKPKIAIPLPSTNIALLDFGAFNNYLQGKDFVYEVMGSVTGTRKNVSTYNQPKEKEAIQAAVDNILNNSTRNLPEKNLNNTNQYTDPVTSNQYPSFYDFLVQSKSLTAEVPGIKGIGNGQDNAYSFHLTGLYLNLPQDVDVVTTQEVQPKVEAVKDIATSSNIEAKKADIERRRKQELDKSYKYNTNKLATFGIDISNPTTLQKQDGVYQEYLATIAKINSKYDAELAALEQPKTPELSPIERRRQMLLKTQTGEKLRSFTPAPTFKTITQKELDWFTSRFGSDALSLAKDVDRVISKGGVEAYGIYHNALVQLAQFAEEGTLYHEAMHFVLDPRLGLVTENRREKILKERKEEDLAEDFRDYMLTGKLPVKPARGLFEKLWSAIKKLLGFKTEIQKLFESTAAFESTPEQRAFFEEARKTGLNEVEEKYRLLPGFINQLEQEKAVQYAGSKIVDYMWKLSKKLNIPVEQILENPQVRSRIQGVGETTKTVSDYLFETLRQRLDSQFTWLHAIPQGQRSDIEAVIHDNYLAMGVPKDSSNLSEDEKAILGHWEDRIDELNQITGFKSEIIKRLSKDLGLRWVQSKSDLKYELEDETADPDEQDTEKAEDIHGIDSSLKDPARGITTTLKLFLATIEDTNNKSIFGNLPINPAEVIRQLKGKLANTPVPFNKLAELASQDQLMQTVYNKLSAELAEGNNSIVDEFNTRFNLTTTNYKTTRVVFRNGVLSTELIDSNRASTAFVLLEKWKGGFQGPILDKEGNPHVASITALNNKLVRGVDSLKQEPKEKRLAGLKSLFDAVLKTMKVELPSEVWENVEKKAENKKNATDLKIRQLESWMVTEGNDTISSFLQSALQPNFNVNRKSIFDRLANLSKDYVRENNEGAPFLGEDGNMRYGVNLPSAASDLFNKIKSDPQNTANYYLQDKFYANNKIVTDIMQNSKNLTNFERSEILAYRQGEADAKDFSDRTTQESAISRLTAFVNNEAKDYGYYYFGTHEAKQKQTLYQLPKKGTGEALPFLKDTLRGIVEAEKIRIKRIKEFGSNSVLGQIDQLGTAARFIYIPELNNIQGLTDSITNGEVSVEEIKKTNDQVEQILDMIIEQQYKGFENYLVNLGLIEKKNETLTNKELPEGLLTSEAKSLPVDTFLRNFFYNDFAWRHELARLFNGDIAQYKSTEDYFKRNYQTVTPGTKPFNDPLNPKMLRTAIHKFMNVPSTHYGAIKDAADSQTWIMPATYKAIAETLGTWTSDHELVYNFAWKNHKTVSQAIRESGVNQQDAEMYREALKKAKTPPLKPFQFSDLVITLPNGEKMIIKEQIKDSRATLNPEFALRNKNFKQLYQWMVDNKVDVVASESGVKLGKFGMIDTAQPATPEQIRIHNLSDLRLPQLNTDNEKTEISGSQKHKLILGDINRKAKYGKITGEELIQRHQELWSELHERDSKELKKKLGFGSNFILAKTSKERFKQLKTIKDKLEKALATKDASENLYDALTIIKDKLNNLKFVSSLALPQNASIFEASLVNLFKKIFLNPKTPGFIGVNMADFVSGVSTDSNLKFIQKDGNIITEAEIGMPVAFFNKIGLNFTEEFVDRQTNKIKWDKLNENQQKALQGVLYRIPTSNKSSMLPIRIVQVVQGEGNVVVLPPETLTQQGLDFDYDKSQVALRVLKEDGTVDDEAIENKIFDLEWEVLTSPHHYDEMLRPLTSAKLEALAEPYKQQASNLSPMNTARDLMAEEQNKDAKVMVGIYSRGNTAHAVLQTIAPFVATDPSFGFPVKAKKGQVEANFTDFGKFEDNDGGMISENFAEYQAGALDAGNKPILYYIAASTVTSPVVVKLLLQGVSPRIIVNFLKQPIISEWLTAYQQEQSNYGATERVLDKFKGLNNKLNQLKDKQITVELTETNLQTRLTAPIESNLDYSARVLQVFLDELQKANVVRNITDVLSIDTFGDMSSTASVQAMLRKAKNLTVPESPVRIDSRVFRLSEAPREAKRIASFFKHALSDSLEFTGQFFPYNTPAYEDALSYLEGGDRQGKGALLSKKTISAFQKFMNFHTTEVYNLIQPTLDKLAPNSASRWKFTDPTKSLWSRIQLLKEATDQAGRATFPEITTNFFVQSVRKGYSQKGDVQMIGVNNNVGNIDRNLLTKSWRDLMTSTDPTARELAYDLVKFAIYTSGFGFTINSFANLIPMEFFIENGITEGHYDMLESLKTNPINVEGAAKSFIRHNFPIIPEIPRLGVRVKPVWNEQTGHVTGYNLITSNLIKPNFIQATGELISFTIPIDSKLRKQQNILYWVKISIPTIINGRRVSNWSLYQVNPSNLTEFRKVQSLGRNYWETTETGDNKSRVPVNQTYPHPDPWAIKESKEVKPPAEEGDTTIPDCSKK